MSHTKGPWLIIGDSVCYDSEYGGPFLSIAEHIKPHNINLIAAAPEMLEQLEALLDGLGELRQSGHDLSKWPSSLQKARTATYAIIKKAKGEL